MGQPEFLFHYTSLETLALILENRTLCFNNLMNVDDVEEAETADMGLFGKYVNVSCWTEEESESIALWNLYTPNMHGVRIKLPLFPFKKYSYKKGQFFLTEDIETYINIEKIYHEDKGSIVANQPQLVRVEYTDDASLLIPVVRTCTPPSAVQQYLQATNLRDIKDTHLSVKYAFDNLGKYKRTQWAFQKEWRYLITSSPMGVRESYPSTLQKQQEMIRRLENKNQKAPYKQLFLELDSNALKIMEVLLGPRMTTAEKILAKALLEKHGLSSQWKESGLRIR